MRAEIQNVLIFRHFPGFRVSPTVFGLARNDAFAGLRYSLEGEGGKGLNAFSQRFEQQGQNRARVTG